MNNNVTTSSLEQFVKVLTQTKASNSILKSSQYESVMDIIHSLIEDVPPPANLSASEDRTFQYFTHSSLMYMYNVHVTTIKIT